MKELVQYQTVTIHDMKKSYPHTDFDQILLSMVKDELITITDQIIQVMSD